MASTGVEVNMKLEDLPEDLQKNVRERAKMILEEKTFTNVNHLLGKDSWRRKWYDIEYGFRHYVMHWEDDRIREHLFSLEPAMMGAGKEPLPSAISYYSARHHERNYLRLEPEGR